ncbi:MAG: bifunctional (p)ppGpp synthetase/guanosine-3',5'-bis(diphosphate) 3'-pyrophosphohydrolase [Acidobacteria bacterium]|nr:bifunctional (p)ppGpp synthetase/guanosine-3',5'-bis(diphosphate) 3'-pyrophosphohydrolase [Acidobacteriota bacterium]
MAKAVSEEPIEDPDALFEQLVASLHTRHPEADEETIRRAYAVAKQAHAGQFRQTGDPYISHPIAVAQILADYGLDPQTIAAALMHDVVEDTSVTLEDLEADFGSEIAMLIDGVTKLDRIKTSTWEERQAGTIRKMAVAMAKDIRVLLIKLADRTHNMRTVAPLPEEKRRRVARETLDVYAPLAHRLGVQEIKHELEERSFAELHPKRRAQLEQQVRRRAPEREDYLTKVMAEVSAVLEEAAIEAEVTGRPKHLYSIYRKMVDSGLEFNEIHDLIGIRIIVPQMRDCYAVLGLIHTMWAPIQGRFKDYIAMPKFNLYKSLHTTVVGPDGKPLEVQIRTPEMDEQAEVGIAAHWRYKEGGTEDDLPLVADILFLQETTADPAEFFDALKLDLYQDEVFALTPRGEVLTLSKGATPVDFAYRVHTDVGHRCVGAKVNGRLVPLATKLESGDIVEIMTSKSEDAHPSRDWLDFVTSSRAAAKIRQWFSKERKQHALAEGREAVTKELRRASLSVSSRDEVFAEVSEELGFSEVDQLYRSVGDGRVSAKTVVGRLQRRMSPAPEATEDLLDRLVAPPARRERPARGIIVEGLDDMLVRIAKCCSSVPGDDIIGFVTVGRGVSVHRSDCANIGSLEEHPERMIEVSWAPEQSESFFVWIQVEALDRARLLRDVTSALSDLGTNIHSSSSVSGRDRIAFLRYELELSEANQLERALSEVRAVDGVYDAYRLVPGAGR